MLQTVNQVAQFSRLPSGQVVNLSNVSRMVPGANPDEVTVYFSGGDKAQLTGDDATFMRKRMRSATALSSNAKTAIFWAVILAAVVLVYMAIKR